MRIAIIGGGLAGLTAAAYLSGNEETAGTVFERSPQLGGRAFTYEKSGFTLNYGAHAVYGIDRHTLHHMEEELDLKFQSKQVDKRKVMYAKHGQLTAAPLDFVNIVKTEVLTPMEKVRFVSEVAAVIGNIHQLEASSYVGRLSGSFSRLRRCQRTLGASGLLQFLHYAGGSQESARRSHRRVLS